MKRDPRLQRRLAGTFAVGALGLWGWIFATGGVVRHPPLKLDRPAVGAVAAPIAERAEPERGRPPAADSSAFGGRASSESRASEARKRVPGDADPRARLADLSARLEALAAAAAPRGEIVDAAFDAAPMEAVARASDDSAAGFLAQAPFEGVRVRSGLRVASFGGAVFAEGEELVPGRVRLARVEPGGVVLATPSGEVRLAAPAPRSEGAR